MVRFCLYRAFLVGAALLLQHSAAAPMQQEVDSLENAASLIQALADDDPQLAKILSDPVALIKWLNSTEGEATLEKLANGMGDLLEDPTKVKSLLSTFESDPIFEDVQKELPEFAAEMKELLLHEEL